MQHSGKVLGVDVGFDVCVCAYVVLGEKGKAEVWLGVMSPNDVNGMDW